MRLNHSLLPVAVLLGASSMVAAASLWGFSDGTLSIQSKGAGVSGAVKESLDEKKPLTKAIELGASDTLKVILTAQEGKTAKRPHQAFLNIKDSASGLETSYAFAVKESGKGKVELTQKDIPSQLLAATSPLSASFVIASFGSAIPYNSEAFSLTILKDSAAPSPAVETPLRYGKLQEIHHTFKDDPKNPPKVISLLFTAIVLVALPILLVVWMSLGANVNHLSKAFSKAPVSHGLFFGSILGMEGIFFMYYTTWNLFQTLPAVMVVGLVIFLSGSRALTEVQGRRLAGLR